MPTQLRLLKIHAKSSKTLFGLAAFLFLFHQKVEAIAFMPQDLSECRHHLDPRNLTGRVLAPSAFFELYEQLSPQTRSQISFRDLATLVTLSDSETDPEYDWTLIDAILTRGSNVRQADIFEWYKRQPSARVVSDQEIVISPENSPLAVSINTYVTQDDLALVKRKRAGPNDAVSDFVEARVVLEDGTNRNYTWNLSDLKYNRARDPHIFVDRIAQDFIVTGSRIQKVAVVTVSPTDAFLVGSGPNYNDLSGPLIAQRCFGFSKLMGLRDRTLLQGISQNSWIRRHSTPDLDVSVSVLLGSNPKRIRKASMKVRSENTVH